MHPVAIELVNVSDLAFDDKNPRLSEADLNGHATENDILHFLWDAMDVRELVMSIAASGFFPHEHLIVAYENGRCVVLEGNRRLAAVKALLDPSLFEDGAARIPVIGPEAKAALQTLPAVRITREEAWRYLGFKHVNGPAKWSSFAKSQYIADIHRNYGIELEDIAQQIGDTHRTVQRLFRGYAVLEAAENLKVFQREDRWYPHFSFSHLYTGIGYAGIGEFIGLRPEGDEASEPVSRDKAEELRELFLWLYGSRKAQTPPVVRKQNPHLRQLESVVAQKEALAALRAGHGLDYAFELSRPSGTVFEESLFTAKRSLQKARGMLDESYDGSEELLRIAGSIANLADSLYEAMERQRSPKQKRRLTQGD